MVEDAKYQRCVARLWALVGATRAGDPHEQSVAANAARQALAEACAGDGYLLLHEVEGALHVNGRQLRLGVDVFAAAQGVAAVMRARGVGEVLFDATVDAESLSAWSRCWAAAVGNALDLDVELAAHGVRGVQACRHRLPLEPLLQLQRRVAPGEDPDSRLRAVFLQHQLIGVLLAADAVPPQVAKAVLQAVVERLLAVRRGLEPLMLLQQDGALLRRSLHVAVLTVVFARVAGWPETQLADVGAAALWHDLGTLLEPGRPSQAAFHWLLERGSDEFWLRCAIVARTWREANGRTIAEVSAAGGGLAALVRLAAVVVAGQAATGDHRRDLPEQLLELADVALQALHR